MIDMLQERSKGRATGLPHRPKKKRTGRENRFMDDTYIWDIPASSLRKKLHKLSKALLRKQMTINADKTEILSSIPCVKHVQLGGQQIAGRDEEHVVQMMGTPRLIRTHTGTIAAAMQAKARTAFYANKAMFLSPDASTQQKTQFHAALWRAGTWPVHTALLQIRTHA